MQSSAGGIDSETVSSGTEEADSDGVIGEGDGITDGKEDGIGDADTEGLIDGDVDPELDGLAEADSVGDADAEGLIDGDADPELDGVTEGINDGVRDADGSGELLGDRDGLILQHIASLPHLNPETRTVSPGHLL